jgi:cytochrome c5
MRPPALRWVGPAVLSLAAAARVAGASETLRPVDSFADIADPARRSAAIFSEAGKVLLHPRCINCHPGSDRPLQGDGRPHEPRVRRGADGHGVPAMRCVACHTSSNYDAVGMPGNAHWALAPASMAWEGRSLRQICEQIKDPVRNGNRKLSAVVEHMRSDSLVGWAWAPGVGREPAPGTQAAFGQLVDAWARSGAACPAP